MTLKFDEEVLVVVGIRLEYDAWHGISLNGFGFLDYPRTGTFHFC